MYSLSTFNAEVSQSWAQIMREGPKDFKFAPPKQERERAFNAYEAACNTNLPLIILGAETLREDLELLKNVGTLATASQCDQKMMIEFLRAATKVKDKELVTKELKKATNSHLTRGCIVNDSNWWIFRNDAFMLGGIHGRREFHLATEDGKIPEDSLLWDEKNKRPRALGRELIMIFQAGYRRIDAPAQMGIVFAPAVNKEMAEGLTLTKCREHFATIKSVDQIKKIFYDLHPNTLSTSAVVPTISVVPNAPES